MEFHYFFSNSKNMFWRYRNVSHTKRGKKLWTMIDSFNSEWKVVNMRILFAISVYLVFFFLTPLMSLFFLSFFFDVLVASDVVVGVVEPIDSSSCFFLSFIELLFCGGCCCRFIFDWEIEWNELIMYKISIGFSVFEIGIITSDRLNVRLLR